MTKKKSSGLHNKLSNQHIYMIRLSQMTTENIEEAQAFPLETLLKFIFNKLDQTQKEIVQKKFWENYCLFDRYLLLEEEIENNGLDSIAEYKVYQAKQHEEHEKWKIREEKYRNLGKKPS